MSPRIDFTTKTWWTVLAPGELAGTAAMEAPCYPWMATGPCGCHCGVEQTHRSAEHKARAAAIVLSNLDDR